MQVSRGDKNNYMGIMLYFSTPGWVKVTMICYLEGVMEDFPGEIIKLAALTAADHLGWMSEGRL